MTVYPNPLNVCTAKNRLCSSTSTHIIRSVYELQHTLVFSPVEDIDVTDSDHTSQVHSPFSCVIAISVDRTLTSSSTVSVHTIYCILTAKVYTIRLRPGVFLPRRFIKCQIFLTNSKKKKSCIYALVKN